MVQVGQIQESKSNRGHQIKDYKYSNNTKETINEDWKKCKGQIEKK